MPGIGQPGGGNSATNPDGTPRVIPHPDDDQRVMDLSPVPEFNFRNVNVTHCAPQQGMRNLVNAVNELYTNIEYIYNTSNAFNLRVSNNEGTVYVSDVRELIANCMSVEDLGGNVARITPKVSEIFKAPPAGIAICNSTTIPSGTCTKCEIQSGVLVTTSDTATVYNLGAAIPGDSIIVAHKVYGCIYVTAGCCENTVISPTGSGSGGSTDPPEPPGGSGGGGQRGECSNATDGTLYYQYDISLYGMWDTGGNRIGFKMCHNCSVADSEPYVIRATWYGVAEVNELFPCGFGGCRWTGADLIEATIPDGLNQFDVKFTDLQCENVAVNLGLFLVDQESFTTPGYLGCVYNGLFTAEEVDDPRGHYLWCQISIGGGWWGEAWFIKKVTSSTTPTFDMDLANYEIDLSYYKWVHTLAELAGNEKRPCQPKAFTPDPDNQGRTYISINKVEAGGLLSV